MAVTPEEGGLPAGVTEKYEPQNLNESVNDRMSLLLYTNLSELVEAATVAPPPGTVIQSRVQVSPDTWCVLLKASLYLN